MNSHRPQRRHVRVALLGSRGIPARYGGFETLVETLASNLPKSRFDVTVFCERGLKRMRPKIPGVSLVYFPVFEKFRIVSEAFYDVVALVWAALASIEVVVLFGYTASVFCALPRLFGKPVLVNVDGLEWKRSKFSRPVRSLLRLAELAATKTASLIVCDSHAIQEYYRRTYGAHSRYVPNPARHPEDLRPDVLSSLRLETGSYYLVVARLEPENHVDLIIKGFLECRTARKLAIVGSLTSTKYVNGLLRMRTPQVVFLDGVYDRASLCSLRAGSFAYVHGHEVGGTNPSLLESMACGTPVVAFDVPYNREVAKDAAFYFTSASELAKRISALESDRRQAQKMGERAKEIAEREYSTTLVVRGYEEMISQSLSRV